MFRKVLRALAWVIEAIIAPFGTNLLGLALMTIVFMPLGILMERFGRQIEGVLNFIGGAFIFGIDWFFRRPREFIAGQSLSELKWDLLFDWERGPRIIYMPAWMVGVIWMVAGLILALIELIKDWSSP
jgi:hypothetical protein